MRFPTWSATAILALSYTAQGRRYHVTTGQSDEDVAAALRALGRSNLRQPGSLPFPDLEPGTDTMPNIEHIVFLQLENHSFDNMLGMLGRGDGLSVGSNGEVLNSNPYPNGSLQHAFPMPNTCQLSSRPSQEWLASHNAYDNGTNTGFVSTRISSTIDEMVGGVAMGYYTSDHLPFTYSLAEHFPIGDRFFCSLLAQTWPNRRFLIAGTPRGIVDDNVNLTAGYAPAGTIFNELDKYGISWNNYAPDCCWRDISGNTPDFFGKNNYDTETKHHKDLPQFMVDALEGNLPAFSFIDPNYANQSQENPQNVVNGEALLADVVNSIGQSPLWSKTLFILNYDEHGGYYDHVPPPPALFPDEVPPHVQPGEYLYEGYGRLGFRVPAIVVSPYAKAGKYVSSVVYDQTSVLATLQRKWNLPAFTYRDANANDMLDFLDLDALKRKEPTFTKMPALAAPGNTTEALACSTTGAGVIPPPGTVSEPKRSLRVSH
ncbi:Phosphoesterase family protein [Penicillium lagena]|uniref:Phosphoesterase family protein n=1 Tax=Penicillium lagena TaxID=94218 RepID=UPI002540C0F2|nr:Phosphoesterase family protein [Penicillium lagena]KAJ5624449.1 Phosphoesterase family protein [Penicillium lagena]